MTEERVQPEKRSFAVGDIVEVAITEDVKRRVLYHGWLAEVIQCNDAQAYIDTDPPVNAGRVRPQAVSFRGWFPVEELIWRADKDWRPDLTP